MQIGERPLTVPAFALGSTVIVLNDDTGLPQPVLSEYVKLDVAAARAVTNPVTEFTVATEVLVLVHAPLAVPLLEIGSASARESVEISVAAAALKKKETTRVLNEGNEKP